VVFKVGANFEEEEKQERKESTRLDLGSRGGEKEPGGGGEGGGWKRKGRHVP